MYLVGTARDSREKKDIPTDGPITRQWQGFRSVPHWKQRGMGKKGTPHILFILLLFIR